ncbi:uncharacterized protein TNCV_1131651 [Trichonephila clavipes]|nr:uncharacterized protein TNCV_1131651 [Trichonephila clavipes]
MQMIRISAQTNITRVWGVTSKRYLRLGDFDDFKFDNCGFFKKRSAMSRRKQQSAFDQVSEFDRGRVACLVMSSSPIPLKTRRVGQRCTLNLSIAETSSHWCGVAVRRGGASSGVLYVI